ncbi:MAG: DMT family transporter [Armatimonadota bacterium]
MAVLSLLAANTLWGLSYVAAKDALESTPSIVLAFLRFAAASLILWPVFLLWEKHRAVGPRPTAGPAAVGACSFFLSYVLFYTGMRLTTASETAMLINLEAVLTALFARLFLREKLSRRQSFGIILALCGALLLVKPEAPTRSFGVQSVDVGLPKLLNKAHQSTAVSRTVGNAFVTAGVAAESAATVFSRYLGQWYSPLELAAKAVSWGAVFLLLPALLQWKGAGFSTQWITAVHLAEIAYLAVGCTVIAYLVWYRSIAKLGASASAASLYVQPVVGVASGVLLLGEQLRTSAVVGALLIGIGVYLTVRPFK